PDGRRFRWPRSLRRGDRRRRGRAHQRPGRGSGTRARRPRDRRLHAGSPAPDRPVRRLSRTRETRGFGGLFAPRGRIYVLDFRAMFNLGMGEIALILILILIFVGPKKLPEMASGLGRALRQIRKATADVKNEIVLDDTFRKPFEELRDAVTLAPEELK